MPEIPGPEAVRQAVSSVRGWYHTLDLPHGVVTPGWFDVRPIAARLPWPDVEGTRCLDIGTWDGFYAFELEKRGAAEVVATDIASHDEWDHLPGTASQAAEYHTAVIGEKGRGFIVAAECLGSSVRRQFVNVYDLSPETVGTFDIVVCGALLLHLRDPFRALAAVASVCRGMFLSVEEVDGGFGSVAGLQDLVLRGSNGQWAVPTVRGHRRMLEMAGFRVEQTVGPFAEPFGKAHPVSRSNTAARIRSVWLRGRGVPKAAVLCRSPAL